VVEAAAPGCRLLQAELLQHKTKVQEALFLAITNCGWADALAALIMATAADTLEGVAFPGSGHVKRPACVAAS
ncbi:MAG: hypothetical protein ACPIOQ_85685, partial [Promethearchaeia archaeon]